MSVETRPYRLTAKRKYHGLTNLPEHATWLAMKQRCSNPKSTSYARYGGRGIMVHSEWVRSFEAFYAYIGPKPTPLHSIDRIDNDGHYEPGNVRWATIQEQIDNTSVVRKFTVDGKTLSLAGWARELGLSNTAISVRLRSGWDIEEAVTTPRFAKRHKWVERDYSKAKPPCPRTDAFMVTIEGHSIPLVTVCRAYDLDHELVYGRLTKHEPFWPIEHALFAPRFAKLRAWRKRAVFPADYPAKVLQKPL